MPCARMRGKLTVFSQIGEIALPPSRRVFGFLERSVVPVDAPLGGVIHPKVWVLRFQALDDPEQRALRALIASRNLTFDASWDTLVRLDESANARGADLSAVGGLFEHLLATASPATVSDAHAQRVASLSAALRTARFALPEGVDEIQVAVLGLTRGPSPLPTDAARSLIISPFLGSDFFTRVRPAPVDEVVSRPESLDLLDAAARRRIATPYVFDDGSSADLDDEQERLSPRDPGRPLVGLHAKVFAFERGGRAHVFLGSANATGAAFSRNVEILVELVGPVESLGIDRLCAGTEDERGLRDLFLPYSEPESAPDAGGAHRARRGAPRDRAPGHRGHRRAERGRDGRSPIAHATSFPSLRAAVIHCWPLASAGNRRRVAPGERLDVRFETTIEAISGFLAFEIDHDDGTRTEFLVPVPLDGVPEQRDRALLRALVGNAERFLRYLLALLEEDPMQMDFLDALDAEPLGATADGAGGARLPVLEKLLRTMRRDPGKLAALQPLVSDLGDDGALPPGFAELWATVYEVAVAGGRSR